MARLDLGVRPAGAGVEVGAAGYWGHELADLGDEGQGGTAALGGAAYLLQFVGRRPPTGRDVGLFVVHQAVANELGDAHAALGIALLPVGEFRLDHGGSGEPPFGQAPA